MNNLASKMFLIFIFALMTGCNEKYATKPNLNKPEGIPTCKALLEFPGYQGGEIEMDGVASGVFAAFHANDLIYQMLGKFAEDKMVVFSLEIKNEGAKRITLSRDSMRMVGVNGTVLFPIPPTNILHMSRGKVLTANGLFEQMGDGLIENEFSASINIGSGEQGMMMVAFPIPFPPSPIVILTIGSNKQEIPICWGG